MNIKSELRYTRDHEWIADENGLCVIGISDYAQNAMGDIVFVNMPQVGDDVTAGESFGDLESVKAVSDMLCPVTGTVAEINEELLDSPEKLNEDPYGAWIIKVSGVTETDELLSAAEYEAFCPEA
ncbi:MAG: glycine cleavage system protein GcvH [Clostridia bacterium]|nr:glycine cleavage system protein GcvH [Clostridia bacterium]